MSTKNVIKGKYVATVVIEFEYDDNSPGVKKFADIKEYISSSDMDEDLRSLIIDELMPFNGEVSVIKQFADAYIEGDKE